MAVTRTERFALHRWDDGSDSFNREQNDTDNRQVEALAAVFRSGLDAGKGSFVHFIMQPIQNCFTFATAPYG
jgi:hypothetical protein